MIHHSHQSSVPTASLSAPSLYQSCRQWLAHTVVLYWELSSHLIYIILIVECPWEWSGYFVQAKYILWLKALWKESQRDLWRLWLLIWKKRWGSRFDDDFLPLCVHKLTERHCSRRLCVTLPVISSLYFLLFFCRRLYNIHHCSSLPSLSLML